MATITSDSASRETVARTAEGLGWFSLGLGVPQLLAPSLVNRIAGIRDDGPARTAQRIVGVRELAAAGGILGMPRPVPFLWARVGGDAMDLMLLGRAWARRRDSTPRLLAVTAQIVGVTALDLFTALNMTKDPTVRRKPTMKTAAVTLDVPMAEAEAAWIALSADSGAPGAATFRPAPGGTGTEVRVTVQEDSPVVDVARKAMGTEPYQRAEDALRRFKQLVEAGEIARSDAMPEGETHERMFPRQRPAQPLEHVPA
ncbi:MAG: cyclase/dehydrase [Conexibacter sp.]|nr:cyclase/dehydrase [Conexibacter sp.]